MPKQAIPTLSVDQVREVDLMMTRDYHIEMIQMMENAGRSLACLARRMLEGDVLDRPIVVLAGRGNNGGGGFVAARHLHNWGAWVQVLCTHDAGAYGDAPAHQLTILQAIDVPTSWADEGWELPPCDLIIDAIAGVGLRGSPHGRARDMILLANSSLAPVLSLDGPSGLDLDGGNLYDPYVQATATMTLALPKRGLLAESAGTARGDLYLADVGVPQQLYERLGIAVESLFSARAVIRIEVSEGIATISENDPHLE
jgi:NAD(P)H-hydrate epimerase